MFASYQEVQERFDTQKYICGPEAATVVYLASRMRKPWKDFSEKRCSRRPDDTGSGGVFASISTCVTPNVRAAVPAGSIKTVYQSFDTSLKLTVGSRTGVTVA